jgi:hypothetical protein
MGNIPRAVQKQAREAEKLQAQLQGNPDQGPPKDQGQPQPQPVVQPKSLDDLPDIPSKDDSSPNGDPSIDWEKRWKNLKTSHDLTVSELRNTSQAQADEITNLRALVEKATSDKPAAQAVEFTAEEREKYGDDFLVMVERVAKSISGNANDSEVTNELQALKDQLGNLVNHQVRSDEDRFFDELDAAVSDWEQINARQDFKEWMAQEMPLTGQERQFFLDQAHKQFDAKRAIAIFNSWKGEVGLQTTILPDTVTTTETDINLGQQQRDTHIFTGKEIEAFYDAKRRGKWRGREEQADQLEARIFLAQREGRVRK